jgi:DDE family transposase
MSGGCEKRRWKKPAKPWRSSLREWRRVDSSKPRRLAQRQHALGRNHGSRYYGWSFEQGVFRYFEHPGHLAPEKALEGKYVIQTEESDLSAVQAVEAYKDLSEVERSFRQLKDLIEMRPIYHRRPKRVRAHIFVAALAFLLARTLEKKLKAAGVPMSSAQALEALRTMHVVDIRVGAEIRRGVTAGNHQARQILAALGISDREPIQTDSIVRENARLVTN